MCSNQAKKKKKFRQFFLFGPKITAPRAPSAFLGQRTIPDSILYIVYILWREKEKAAAWPLCGAKARETNLRP